MPRYKKSDLTTVIITNPVSYTHLDVYKRQAWYSVREFHIHLSGMPLDGQIKDGLERALLLLTELSELSANAPKVEIKNAI